MTHQPPPARALKIPLAQPAHFAKNFIKQAVCELRFPTLFELTESDRPPLAFSKSLRKEYPTHDLLKDVNVNAGGLAQATAHAFRSKKGRWTVTLRAAALTLETTNYDGFAEFEDRLRAVIEAAVPTIDSDFFTRVGLRYINAFPFISNEIQQWVAPQLVGPLADGTFGDVEEFSQSVRGSTADGGYIFRHGLSNPVSAGGRDYVLDFDFFRDDVAVSDTIQTVRKLHEHEFSMFSWSLGEKAKQELGPSTLERKS